MASGGQPRLTQAQLEKLQEALLAGPHGFGYATQLWTLERIAEVIHRLFAVRHSSSQVWAILRKLGWSCQKPATRAKERGEKAIRKWLRQRWPEIKKGAQQQSDVSFLWTRVVFLSVPVSDAHGRAKEKRRF